MSLTPLLSFFFVCFSLLFYSVDSCSTASISGVTLTGVCPNDTFTVPVGTTLQYSCSYNFSGSFVAYWNVSGNIASAITNPLPAGISISSNNDRSVLTIVTMNAENLINIQCGLCQFTECFTDAQEFIGTESIQLIAFGPPSSLSHELRENDTVKLSWLPPPVEAVSLFTYNIIIMESTNNSLIVTNINITNNTYVIISPNDIMEYTQCKEYQWGVRAGGSNVSLHGFTTTTMADSNFTIISAPAVSDELIVSADNSTSYNLQFNVSFCEYNDLFNTYTYTLLQRDYCKREINSSLIRVTSEQIDDNDGLIVSISVNIGSLIQNSTWSVAVSVSNRFGSDTTDYTNITSNSDDGSVINCQSDLLMSSTILSSQTISTVSSTVFSTSPLPSLSSPPVVTETPTLGTSDPNGSSSSGVVVPVVGTLLSVLLLVAVIAIVIVIVAVILYKRKKDNKIAGEGITETNGFQGSNGNGNSNNMGAHSSTNNTNDETIVNDGYQSQQLQSSGTPGPQSSTDEQEQQHSNDDNTYDQLDALQSNTNDNTYDQLDALQPDTVLHLGSITSPDPMYQEPGTLLPPPGPGGRSRSKSPSHLNSLYSEPLDSAQATPIRSRCSVTPQRFDSQPVMDSGLVDMPGYTEIPANTRKSTISKRKSEIRSPSAPLPPTPVEQEAQHQYADLGEIRKNQVVAPPIVINDDVLYADVTSVSQKS